MIFNKNRSKKSHKEKEAELPDFSGAKSRTDSIDTIATYNPILGFSESEPKRRRLKEEYSEYVWKSLKHKEAQSRSKSRRRENLFDQNHDSITIANLKNEYAHKQRYKHSYFKYRDDNSSSSPQRNQEDSFSYIKVEDKSYHEIPTTEGKISRSGILKAHFSQENLREEDFNRRQHSPAQTNISILPHEHESPYDKEKKKKALAAELLAQIHQREAKKKKEKETRKNQDYKYLYDYIQSNPFGKMGSGAPLRDSAGHIVAHRLKMMDEATTKSFHKSFYHQNSDDDEKDDTVSQRKLKIQNLNEAEIGLQFLSWSNQERKRKEMQRQEWKQQLDEQTNFRKQSKEETKNKTLIEDLKLEEKIKRDLQQMNEEYERETGRKANKYNNTSVGKENSVNYIVPKRNRVKNSQYHKSRVSSKEDSFDRMNDFNGLDINEDDHDVRSKIDQGYTNDVNIRNLRNNLQRREGSVDK